MTKIGLPRSPWKVIHKSQKCLVKQILLQTLHPDDISMITFHKSKTTINFPPAALYFSHWWWMKWSGGHRAAPPRNQSCPEGSANKNIFKIANSWVTERTKRRKSNTTDGQTDRQNSFIKKRIISYSMVYCNARLVALHIKLNIFWFCFVVFVCCLLSRLRFERLYFSWYSNRWVNNQLLWMN